MYLTFVLHRPKGHRHGPLVCSQTPAPALCRVAHCHAVHSKRQRAVDTKERKTKSEREVTSSELIFVTESALMPFCSTAATCAHCPSEGSRRRSAAPGTCRLGSPCPGHLPCPGICTSREDTRPTFLGRQHCTTSVSNAHRPIVNNLPAPCTRGGNEHLRSSVVDSQPEPLLGGSVRKNTAK